MRRYFETKDMQIKRAMKDIDGRQECHQKWLYSLLHILEQGHYATITAKNGKLVDVEAIAYTTIYASFFDVLNKLNFFNTNISPIEVEKLTNRITSII